ncbi:MAG: response regulator [Alphaproteobacteria bacterium]|nr:response regulator [Alphaproteobacteria bacterium]
MSTTPESPLAAGRQVLVDGFEIPAALCDAAGRVVIANAAFKALEGPGRRQLLVGASVFAAFRAARREGYGEAPIETPRGVWRGEVSLLAPDVWLVRLSPPSAASTGPAFPAADAGRGQALLAAAPFAMARARGADPLRAALDEANPALRRLIDRALAPGETLADLITPASLAELDAAWASAADGATLGPFEVTLRGERGAIAQLSLARHEPEVWLVYLLDISAQRAVQLQLAQRNKMEAVGQLAGGVAHDFNNLLSAIRLRAEDLLSRHPLGDPAYESLSEIRETVGRAAELVRKLLTFSRKATVQRDTLDLAEALGELEVLLRRLLREDMRLVTEYGRNIPAVRLDRALFENAIMNLVVNARDAIRASGQGGEIRLSSRRVSPSEAGRLGFAETAASDLALIEVADDGPGMTPDILASVFDPFFTTKPVGEGTGLGLAMVYGAVKQAGGAVIARSTPGQGAAFRIFLPAYVAPPRLERPGPAPSPRTTGRDLSGRGVLLLVEDEALVRGITARLLRARGYEVLEAGDGDAALELARAHAGRIDLMISDVVMPGLDGPGLLAAARPFLQGAPVLFVSGYAEAEFSDLLEGAPEVSFLPKPLDIKTLAAEVKRRLEEGRDDA